MINCNESSNDEDTDSLEIKPPQMISRYDKQKKSSGSSSRDKKHSRGEHRHKDRTYDRTERHARQQQQPQQQQQHHSNQPSGRHHTNSDSYDKYHLSSRDSSQQKRLVCNFSFDQTFKQFKFCVFFSIIFSRKRYSPEKTDGERELEDLRSRLLSKRSKQDIDRKIEEHQLHQRK